MPVWHTAQTYVPVALCPWVPMWSCACVPVRSCACPCVAYFLVFLVLPVWLCCLCRCGPVLCLCARLPAQGAVLPLALAARFPHAASALASVVSIAPPAYLHNVTSPSLRLWAERLTPFVSVRRPSQPSLSSPVCSCSVEKTQWLSLFATAGNPFLNTLAQAH